MKRRMLQTRTSSDLGTCKKKSKTNSNTNLKKIESMLRARTVEYADAGGAHVGARWC